MHYFTLYSFLLYHFKLLLLREGILVYIISSLLQCYLIQRVVFECVCYEQQINNLFIKTETTWGSLDRDKGQSKLLTLLPHLCFSSISQLGKIRLLDVGSCFNPFLKFDEFLTVGIDIVPAVEVRVFTLLTLQ